MVLLFPRGGGYAALRPEMPDPNLCIGASVLPHSDDRSRITSPIYGIARCGLVVQGTDSTSLASGAG